MPDPEVPRSRSANLLDENSQVSGDDSVLGTHRVRERDCPEAVGRRDHVVEVTFTGTAIARFSPARHRPGGPAVAIMPLGSQHRQGRL